jgi:hypothetical protein
VLALVLLTGVAACAAPPQPPPARSGSRVSLAAASPTTTASAAPAPVSLTERLRQEGWMTRFWEQLTPSQRRRVLARLRRGEPPMTGGLDEAGRVWDALGLPERNSLIFGAGLPRERLEAVLPEIAVAGPAP